MKESSKLNKNYLFFSSIEFTDTPDANLSDASVEEQAKRVFDMAKLFLEQRGFRFEDIYSAVVLVKDMRLRNKVNEVYKAYFQEKNYPIRVIAQKKDIEKPWKIKVDFAAYKGKKEFVNTGKGHIPTGPFSQAVLIENQIIHCSGVRPLDPITQKLVKGDFQNFVVQCLQNLQTVLEEVGTGLLNCYHFTVYFKDSSKLNLLEETFKQYFSKLINNEVQANYFWEQTEPVKVDNLNEGHEIEISCSAFL